MKHLREPLFPLSKGGTANVTKTFQQRLKFLAPLLLLLAVWCILSPAKAFAADAPNPNPGILPPNATAFGRTYGAWSAAWWQYVLAQPASSNPVNDPTGLNCRQGQSGPVFFLVGLFGSGGDVTRDKCTVPTGKALFFPLVNAVDIHVPDDGLDTPELLWADLQNLFGPPNNLRGATFELHAAIDKIPVGDLTPATTPYRACAGPAQALNGAATGCASPSFSVTLPEDNLFSSNLKIPVPAGVYPAVSDGFYLLLAPLTPGQHTITFGGTFLFEGTVTTQEFTYHLVVSPS